MPRLQMPGTCHPDLHLPRRHSLTAGSPGQVERHVAVPTKVDHSDGVASAPAPPGEPTLHPI
jgi:hypothetical protein